MGSDQNSDKWKLSDCFTSYLWKPPQKWHRGSMSLSLAGLALFLKSQEPYTVVCLWIFKGSSIHKPCSRYLHMYLEQ